MAESGKQADPIMKIEVSTMKGRTIKLTEKARDNTKILVRNTNSNTKVGRTNEIGSGLNLNKSDVSLIDLNETTKTSIGFEGEESKLLDLALTQPDPQISEGCIGLDDERVGLGQSGMITSTQKNVMSDEEVLETENCHCSGCEDRLETDDISAECDGCKEWYCTKCIMNDDNPSKKEINSKMKTIKMTEQAQG